MTYQTYTLKFTDADFQPVPYVLREDPYYVAGNKDGWEGLQPVLPDNNAYMTGWHDGASDWDAEHN